jgi:hypothetical protein
MGRLTSPLAHILKAGVISHRPQPAPWRAHSTHPPHSSLPHLSPEQYEHTRVHQVSSCMLSLPNQHLALARQGCSLLSLLFPIT